jgi:nitrite reductase (NADH) large subunit
VVIGGGLLGLEAARGLLKFGVDVHVVHSSGHLMNNQLDPAAGGLLKKAVGRLGITTHLGKRTSKILGDDSVTGLEFEDGTSLACDMVVISAGITPNVEIARECGLLVERAIVVDDQMRSTADPDIYAVGECAQHRGKVYGLVAPLWEQGQILAAHLTGKNPAAVYTGSKVATKLKAAGISLATMGVIEPEHDTDEVVIYTESRRGIYQKLILRDDTLIGAILLGDTDRAAALMQAFDRGTPLDENRRAALFDMGEPPVKPQTRLLLMPDDAKVCNCMALSKKAIRKCVEAGNTTLPMVQSACKAGTGCGTCKPLVQEIITWVTDGVAGSAAEAEGGADGINPDMPLDNPEIAAALKLLVRGLSSWANND